MGNVKPVPTVVTGQGTPAAGVTIETEGPLPLAVQKRFPSKVRSAGVSPRLLARVVTAPAGCAGSIRYSLPGVVPPAMKTLPAAATGARADVAPVQVSSSLPSLPRTRETVPPVRLATQMSAPSDWT